MRTVYKYELNYEGKVELPLIHKILKWAALDNQIFLWVEVDTKITCTIKKEFTIVGTGWDIEGYNQYVDTVFDKSFVWHIYEVKYDY